MYNTAIGQRILHLHERYHFGESLGSFVDYLINTDGTIGIAGFDDLQFGQKLTTLYLTARPLFRPDHPVPAIKAAHEAAIAAIFENSRRLIEIEIDSDKPLFEESERFTNWRTLVRRAAMECLDHDEYPDIDGGTQDEWECILQCLSDRIIWDHDYQMSAMLDAAPEQSKMVRSELGIDDDYYTWIPPDLKESDYNLYIDAIRGILPEEREYTDECSGPEDVPF